jgi:hypothetical protein
MTNLLRLPLVALKSRRVRLRPQVGIEQDWPPVWLQNQRVEAPPSTWQIEQRRGLLFERLVSPHHLQVHEVVGLVVQEVARYVVCRILI